MIVNSSLGHSDNERVVSEVRKASSRLKILRIADFGLFKSHGKLY